MFYLNIAHDYKVQTKRHNHSKKVVVFFHLELARFSLTAMDEVLISCMALASLLKTKVSTLASRLWWRASPNLTLA